MLQPHRVRRERRGPAPRGRHRRPGRDRHGLRPAARSRPTASMLLKYVVKNVALAARQDGDVHAEADLRGQRLGDARPPVALEGRQEPDVRRDRLRAAVGHRALLHRRSAAARGVDPRDRGADDELVPPSGAGLRGAGEPRVLAAEPLGVRAHPGVLEVGEGEARRVPSGRTRRRTRTSRSARC